MDNQIKQALLDVGWSENDINSALALNNNPAQNSSPSQYAPPSTPSAGTLIGAKVIAVVCYLFSIFFIVAGIIFAYVVGSLNFSFLGPLGGLRTGFIPGFLFTAWGVLNFFAGRGLWMGKQWGKTLAITINALWLLFGIIEIFKFGNTYFISTYAPLVVNLFIVFYLLFSNAIKNSFLPSSKKIIGSLLLLAVAIYIPIGVMLFKKTSDATYQPLPSPTNTNQNNDCGSVSLTGVFDPTKRTDQDKTALSCFSNGVYNCSPVKIYQGNLSLEILKKEGGNCLVKRVLDQENKTCSIPIIVIDDLKKFLEQQKDQSLEGPVMLFISGATANEGSVRDLITNQDFPINCVAN